MRSPTVEAIRTLDTRGFRESERAVRAVQRRRTKACAGLATGIVFRTILDLDPMSAGPSEITEALTETPDEDPGTEPHDDCDASIPDHHELMEWLWTSAGYWDDGKFRKALGLIEGAAPRVCTPGCAHERIAHVARECGRVYDRIVASSETPTQPSSQPKRPPSPTHSTTTCAPATLYSPRSCGRCRPDRTNPDPHGLARSLDMPLRPGRRDISARRCGSHAVGPQTQTPGRCLPHRPDEPDA